MLRHYFLLLSLTKGIQLANKNHNHFEVKDGYLVLNLINYEGKSMMINSTINSVEEVKSLAEEQLP